MQLRSGQHKLDAYCPTFDPHLDIATVVFSHVQCVKTRVNLAVVSKLWRDASKPAAAYPLRFDFDGFPGMSDWWRSTRVIGLLDNDEALSLPYETIIKLFRDSTSTASNYFVCNELCYSAASLGSVRLLKWTRVNNLVWNEIVCSYAASSGHLPALKYLHENGCPWGLNMCHCAAGNKQWDCLQYAIDNKCPGGEYYAKIYAEHLR